MRGLLEEDEVLGEVAEEQVVVAEEEEVEDMVVQEEEVVLTPEALWLDTVRYSIPSWLLLLVGVEGGAAESLLARVTRSGTGVSLGFNEGSLAARCLAALSLRTPPGFSSTTPSVPPFNSAEEEEKAPGVGVLEEGPGLGEGSGPLWGVLWRELCSSWGAEAGLRGVGVDVRVGVGVVVPPALVAREMVVILTTLTELRWGEGMTVLMGLLVISRVGGERSVMALLAEGLGRICA